MSEAVLDVAALDASASAVEAEIPAIETPAEAPAKETPVEARAEAAKTEDSKPADDAVADTTTAPITPKVINSQLQELAKTNKPLATAIHSHVKQGLESQKFLKENGVKDFSELKTKLSAPDEATEQFRQSVEASDELLYRGDLKELSNNVLEDITAELGDAAPARLSVLSEALLEKITEADPAGATRIQRAQFLAASETSGLINSLNKLNGYIVAGDTKSAANLLKSIGRFFSEEIAANENVAKTRTEGKAAAEKETAATVTKLRGEAEASVDKSMNITMGGFLRPFLQSQLKGVPRTELVSLAETIKTEAKLALGKDAAYVDEVSKLWQALKTPRHKERLMQKFEAALKKNDFGKRLVERVCREKFPEKFTAKPVTAAKPTTAKINVNGTSQDAYVFAKRPENLIRDSVTFKGREYHASDLQQMQMMSRGFVKSKTGNPILVTWKVKA
jgi:hypothetical protein